MRQEIERISSVNVGELFLMFATDKIIHEEAFQCERCLNQKTTPESLERIRVQKGCFDSDRPRYTLDSFRVKTCIGNFYSPAVFFWYKNFVNFRRGMLPFSGNLLEQPAKAIEIFQIFENIEGKRNKEEQEKLESKKRAQK